MSKISWAVPKKELEEAVFLITTVPTRSGVHSSEYIKMSKHDDKSASFSLTSEASGVAYLHSAEKYPFKHDIFLDRRLLEPFVTIGKETKGADYIFSVEKDEVHIKHGHRRAVYAKGKESKYLKAPKYSRKNKVDLDTQWGQLLKCAVACGTDDSVTPQFNCVFIVPNEKGAKLYSTNTTVAFIGEASKHSPPAKIAFPLMLASMSATEGVKRVEWDDKSATLVFDKGKLWQAVKIEARRNFPYKDIEEMEKALKKSHSAFVINASSLSAAAIRMNSYLAAVTREDLVLKMITKAKSKTMQLVCRTGSTMFSEQVALEHEAKKDYEIQWPLEEVLPALQFGKNDGIAKVYITEKGRTLFSTKRLSLVVAQNEDKKKK